MSNVIDMQLSKAFALPCTKKAKQKKLTLGNSQASHQAWIQSFCKSDTIAYCHQDAWNMWVVHLCRQYSSDQMTIRLQFGLFPLACDSQPGIGGWHKLCNGVSKQARVPGKL